MQNNNTALRKFKAGDLVIELCNNFNIEALRESGCPSYPLCTDDDSYTEFGYSVPHEGLPDIVLATKENIQAIKTLKPDVEISEPLPPSTKIIKDLVSAGRIVLAKVSDLSEEDAISSDFVVAITAYEEGEPFPFVTNESCWGFAVAINEDGTQRTEIKVENEPQAKRLAVGDTVILDESLIPTERSAGDEFKIVHFDADDGAFLTDAGFWVEQLDDSSVILYRIDFVKFRIK